MSNALKAAELLASVRALRPDPNHVDKLGLQFYDELGPPVTLEQAKRLHVQRVLLELDWNVSHAAKVLDVNRRTLHRMIDRYDLDPKRKPKA